MSHKVKTSVCRWFGALKEKSIALLAVSMVAVMPRFALAGIADFDPSTVTAKITEYVGYGILMLAAFILGKWTLKALGVIGGK